MVVANPRPSRKTPPLRICTYNVQSARNTRLELVASAFESMNVDLAVITEAKLQGGVTLEEHLDMTSRHRQLLHLLKAE